MKKREITKIPQLEKEFYDCVKDIIFHPVVVEMKKYPHHCGTDCYQHCLNVAYYTFVWCKKAGLHGREAARAGLLHDLFLYDWHDHARETGNHFHGLTHPKVALENAEKYFELNPLERDIILKHMWPLTVIPPRYPEALLVTFADKYCGSREIIEYYSNRFTPRQFRFSFGHRISHAREAYLKKIAEPARYRH